MQQQISKFWTFFIDKFRVSSMMIIFIFLFGIFAYQNLPRENAPDIEIPVGVVTTFWPGASSLDVEQSITNKIELEIKNLENLKKLESISKNGISMVIAEFEVGTNLDKNFQNLRDAIDNSEPKLPSNLPNQPQVTEASLSDVPIVSLAISGDFSWTELRRFAEILEDEFSKISGVKEVSIKGVPDPKLHIYVDPKKLEFFGLDISTVTNSIRAQNLNVPMGDIFIEGQKIEVRIDGELREVSDFENVVVASVSGNAIKLSDIAEVRREFAKSEIKTFFTTGADINHAVSIDIIKTGGRTNILQTVATVFDELESLRNKNIIPENLAIETTFDGAKDIRENLNVLLSTGTQTLVIILIILFIFLGIRESLIAAISIPMSIFVTMIFLYFAGRTFNFISLFALVIAIGLVVDNAIILTEAVSENIFNKKMPPHKAALQAITDFRSPVIAGTLTTIFAFLPMLFFISGVNGEFISHLPITVIVVLVSSLFVSIFLIPMMAVKFFEYFPPDPENIHAENIGIMSKTIDFYRNNMPIILKKKWLSFLVVAGAIVAMGASFMLPVGVEIFPVSDQNFFTTKVELPLGSKLSET